MNTKRLYRSREDRQLAGVCGGLAEYFNVDPTLVRLVFVAMTLLGGPGLLIYIIMAVVVPESPRHDYDYDDKAKNDYA
ncbi:MAG: PspC domain-containing protein [Anaerolineae bacterium]|nr:PspC domain-containing protein [Anaerolineae bacterium]MDW8171472.1 PspC domain-containing protein [Anaerolineae bacterium]